MSDPTVEFRNSLNSSLGWNRFASFVTRRLSAIGAVYTMVFGAFLLLAMGWRGEDKKTGTELGLFTYFDKSSFGQLMDGRVQAFIAIAIALLLLCIGWSHRDFLPRLGGTLLLIPFVTMPVLLEGDVETVILMRCMHAVLLLASGLILDRTFGYTRALARSNFYLGRLDMLTSKPDSEKKTEELEKLVEAYAIDKYRDHFGDTFFALDAIRAKLGSK
jgi:hypothetical protein